MRNRVSLFILAALLLTTPALLANGCPGCCGGSQMGHDFSEKAPLGVDDPDPHFGDAP